MHIGSWHLVGCGWSTMLLCVIDMFDGKIMPWFGLKAIAVDLVSWLKILLLTKQDYLTSRHVGMLARPDNDTIERTRRDGSEIPSIRVQKLVWEKRPWAFPPSDMKQRTATWSLKLEVVKLFKTHNQHAASPRYQILGQRFASSTNPRPCKMTKYRTW
jgi:hypothetical protein